MLLGKDIRMTKYLAIWLLVSAGMFLNIWLIWWSVTTFGGWGVVAWFCAFVGAGITGDIARDHCESKK